MESVEASMIPKEQSYLYTIPSSSWHKMNTGIIIHFPGGDVLFHDIPPNVDTSKPLRLILEIPLALPSEPPEQ